MAGCDIGIYGLGIMGQNLALNFAGRDFSVAVYNRSEAGEEEVLGDFLRDRCQGSSIVGCQTVDALIAALPRPRSLLLMIKAGPAVDAVIAELLPYLAAGDVLIDGGNSHYADTVRRCSEVGSHGIHYLGCGISGGAEGALRGPAIMPGGSPAAWERVGPLLESIAARNRADEVCCRWVGPDGAGHFVKMVHNGIEYALMQQIAEVYDVFLRILGLSAEQIANLFEQWNREELHSFLLGISSKILRTIDGDGQPLLDKIRDCAAHKGTGRDTALTALSLGVATPVLNEAVCARFLSSDIDSRASFASEFGPGIPFDGDQEALVLAMREALYCAQLIAYAQGLELIAQASNENCWEIDLHSVTHIWSGGCIVQSSMIGEIGQALLRVKGGAVLLDRMLVKALQRRLSGWRSAIATAISCAVPVPTLAAALNYFSGLCSEKLPANLLQAQRDFFGAHGFGRLDQPGAVCHAIWGSAYEDL